jgi:hypothetical protein
MEKRAIKVALGLFAVASILAVASPASAQRRWANAKNRNEVLAVANGPQCSWACFLTDGQSVVVWNSTSADTGWNVPEASLTDEVTNALLDSQHNQLCLGVSNGSTSPGAGLVVWPCNGHDDQAWTPWPASDWGLNAPGCYILQNNDGLLMGVAGGNVTNGARVVQRVASPVTLDMAWCPL